jgi:hypothetical protein
MVPLIDNEYALLLPLAIPALAEESARTSKLLKALITKTVKPKKPVNEID